MANTYRSTIVLDKVHVTFFNSDYFGEMTTRINEHLLAQFTVASEIEFETALHFHDEGYEGSDDYNILKLLIRLTTSTQYHQQLKLPSTPQIINNQQHPPPCQPQNKGKWNYHFIKQSADD